jgi:hypothetical protein
LRVAEAEGIIGSWLMAPVHRLLATFAAAAVLMGACVGPTLTPTAGPTPTPSPSPSPTPGGAELVVAAEGTIDHLTCELSPSFGGCVAIFVVMPGQWTPPANWLPSADDGYFRTTDAGDGYTVDPQGVRIPAQLEAGAYTVALGIAEFNDVIPADEPFAAGLILCQTPFSVTEQTVKVEVRAVYGADCAIDITLTPPL